MAQINSGNVARHQRFFDSSKHLLLFLGFCVLSPEASSGKIDVAISTVQSPVAQTVFSWSGNQSFTIDRRLLGQMASTDWVRVGQVLNSTSFTDSPISETGKTYEYRIYNSSDITVTTASFAAPLEDARGGVILVVDSSVKDQLEGDIELFEMDLAGDGWFVKRIDCPPNGTGNPVDLKNQIKALCAEFPDIDALFIFGNAPVVSSGYLAPDGHDLRPHETDIYYGDLDGIWTDTGTYGTVNLPGDGQFDQSYYPSPVELQVGRVVFDRMSSSRKWAIDMLRDYLHKDHAWRHAMRDVPNRAAGGDFYYHGLWRNWLSTVLAPPNVSESNGYSRSRTQPQLFVVGRGNDGIDPMAPSQAIFMSNFQSYRQEWYADNNANMQNVAQPDWGLNSVWGDRPQYFLHGMAGGKTIGDTFRQNQNEMLKSSIAKSWHSVYTGNSTIVFGSSAAYVSNNLLGDPTLRMHPVQPAKDLRASTANGSVSLTWSPSTSSAIEGYHVYRSADRFGVYARLTASPIQSAAWLDTSQPSGETYYQVRAVKLESLPTGTYYNQSQGTFARINGDGSTNHPPSATGFSIKGKSNTPLQFSFEGVDPDGDDLTPIVLEHPKSGFLREWKGQWFYVSTKDFAGSDSITFAMSDDTCVSEPATIDITVDEIGTTLLAWDFPDGSSQPDSTYNSPNIFPSTLTVSGYQILNSWPNEDQFSFRYVEATKGRYVAWTIEPRAGRVLHLDKMHFATATASGTQMAFEVRASLDGFATSFEVPVRTGNGFTGTGTTSHNRGQVHWMDLDTLPQLQGFSGPVQFRVYFWRAAGGSSSDVTCFGKMTEAEGYEDGIEDISITGTAERSDGAENAPPQGQDDAYAVAQDSALAPGPGEGVLANDNDPDGDGLYAFLVSPTSRGQISLSSDGSFIYTPDSGFNGTDAFTYRISDGSVFSGPFTAGIRVYSNAEAWRVKWFGTPENSGEGANSATPANDGISNLLKFATGDGDTDPKIPGVMPGELAVDGGGTNLLFTYTRSKTAVAAGVIYAVKWSDTLLDGSWSSIGIGAESVVDHGEIEEVTVSIPTGNTGKRFARLEVWENAAARQQIEVILDNSSAEGVTKIGSWTSATSTAGYYGTNYLHDGNIGKGSKSVAFTPDLPAGGDYAVYARWTAASNRATNVPFSIASSSGTSSLQVDQTTNHAKWVLLGIYRFDAGTSGSLTISNAGTSNYVIVDAVRWLSQ